MINSSSADRGRQVTLALALVLSGLTVAALAYSLPGNADRLTTGSHQQQGDPCSNLGGDILRTRGFDGPFASFATSDYVLRSDVVAKAIISDTGSPRFETLDGLPPPPPTTTPQPTVTPEPFSDDPDDYIPGRILSPVVLDTTTVYSGSAVAGYVVARWGGVSAACPDYLHDAPGDVMTGSIGESGIAFLRSPPSDWAVNPPDWFTHLVSVANGISTPGNEYIPMLMFNWYLYDMGSGMASTALVNEPISITLLETEVSQAIP